MNSSSDQFSGDRVAPGRGGPRVAGSYEVPGDDISIDTPELVAIEMPLAGIGSRFIALMVDYLIWGSGLLLLSVLAFFLLPAMHAFNVKSAQWAEAIVIFAVFLFNWGYFTLFEAFWNGRTPGKRVARIRVMQRSGRSIGLLESMARNLVRYVDQIPFFYAVGAITMFSTSQHQRLGDLVAGTLVVRDREADSPLWADAGAGSVASLNGLAQEGRAAAIIPGTAIARLTIADLQVLEGFFARRLDMSVETRRALGQQIASALESKMELKTPEEVSVETFLESVSRQLRDVIRLQ
jgi:uncharacterized RDD family membrane protein YckC